MTSCYTSTFQKEPSSASPTAPYLQRSGFLRVLQAPLLIFSTEWAANKVGGPAGCEPPGQGIQSNAMGPKPKTTILLFPYSVDAMTQLSDAIQNPAWFIFYDILMYTVGSQVDKPERPAYFVPFLYPWDRILNHSNETSIELVIYYVVSDVQSQFTK